MRWKKRRWRDDERKKWEKRKQREEVAGEGKEQRPNTTCDKSHKQTGNQAHIVCFLITEIQTGTNPFPPASHTNRDQLVPTAQPPDTLQRLFHSSLSAERWVAAGGGCGSAWPGFKEKRRSLSLLAATIRRIRSPQRYLHPPSSSFILLPPPPGRPLLSEWSGVIYSLCEALEQVSGPEKWSCGVIQSSEGRKRLIRFLLSVAASTSEPAAAFNAARKHSCTSAGTKY